MSFASMIFYLIVIKKRLPLRGKGMKNKKGTYEIFNHTSVYHT